MAPQPNDDCRLFQKTAVCVDGAPAKLKLALSPRRKDWNKKGKFSDEGDELPSDECLRQHSDVSLSVLKLSVVPKPLRRHLRTSLAPPLMGALHFSPAFPLQARVVSCLNARLTNIKEAVGRLQCYERTTGEVPQAFSALLGNVSRRMFFWNIG